jgi:hypothetical protein
MKNIWYRKGFKKCIFYVLSQNLRCFTYPTLSWSNNGLCPIRIQFLEWYYGLFWRLKNNPGKVSCSKKYWPEPEVGISNLNAPSVDKLR